MIEFQSAERKRLEEPASEVGLEPLCAMVSNTLQASNIDDIFLSFVTSITFSIVWFGQINNNLRCYELSTELSNSTMESLPPNYAEQVFFSTFFSCFTYFLLAMINDACCKYII